MKAGLGGGVCPKSVSPSLEGVWDVLANEGKVSEDEEEDLADFEGEVCERVGLPKEEEFVKVMR